MFVRTRLKMPDAMQAGQAVVRSIVGAKMAAQNQ